MESTRQNLFVVYDDLYLNWLLGKGDGSHVTNPMRAKLAMEKLIASLGDRAQVVHPVDPTKERSDEAALAATHDASYIKRVMSGDCSEWDNLRPIMGETAFRMFQGTIRAVEIILSGKGRVVFNPQGAKHHAQFAKADGFCVFNDMAYAAIALKAAGLKVLYLDWDIHAGDGVAHMLKGKGIPCISIHNGGIFPGDRWLQSGQFEYHHLDELIYNFNVKNGDGDDVFMKAIDGAREIIDAYQPDVILLAAGADGHTGANGIGVDSNYTSVGFKYAAEMVAEMANKHADGRVIIGGAGGYQPLKETPETWALVVEAIYKNVSEAFD
jgi:acetoin utilization protein AcuC